MNKTLFYIIFTLLVPILFVSISAQEFTTLKFFPTDDAFVITNQNESSDQLGLSKINTGDQDLLKVRYSNNATPAQEQIISGAYLKFDISEINSDYVEEAHLALWLTEISSPQIPTPISVFYVEDETWSELDLTFDTKPGFSSEPIDSIYVDFPQLYHWEITELVKLKAGSKVSLFLVITEVHNNTIEHFYFPSKEYSKEKSPQLQILYSDPEITSIQENDADPEITPIQENDADYTLAIIIAGLIAAVICIGILFYVMKRNISAKQDITQNNLNELKTLTKTDTESQDHKEFLCSSCKKELSSDFKLCPYCGHLTK